MTRTSRAGLESRRQSIYQGEEEFEEMQSHGVPSPRLIASSEIEPS